MRTRTLTCLTAIGLALVVLSPGVFGVRPTAEDRWLGVWVLETTQQVELVPFTPHVSFELADNGHARARVAGETLVGIDVEIVTAPDGTETEGDRTALWNPVDAEWTGRWSDGSSAVVRLADERGDVTVVRLRWDATRDLPFVTARALRPLLILDLPGDVPLWFTRPNPAEEIPPGEGVRRPPGPRAFARHTAMRTR